MDVVDRYAAGTCSLVEVARVMGVAREAARAELTRRGVAVRGRGRPGGSSPLARVLTAEYLHEHYVVAGRSVGELAVEWGCTHKTVRRYLVGHGIEVREERSEPSPQPSIAELRRCYVDEGMSVSRAAEELGCSPAVVRSLLERHGVRRRPAPGGSGLGREALWEAYVMEGRSTTAIAEMAGCGASTVARDLRRHGIPVRRRGGAPPAAERWRARRAGIRRGVVAADI